MVKLIVARTDSTMSLDRTVKSIIENPDGCSLKRIAWAFGCSRKGSEEERKLEEIIKSRIASEEWK